MAKIKKTHILLCAIGALLLTAVVMLGTIKRIDTWVSDRLFQRAGLTNGNILVIGIDDKALNAIGPYNTWDRHIYAKALEALNSDPAKKPAVTALDMLYTGESDPEADRHLAKAAASLGNVVTASFAELGEQVLTDQNGHMSFDNYAVLNYEEPYEDLKNVTTQGHINAQYDTDGIMRHALLYIEPGDSSSPVYSFSYEASKLYMEDKGGLNRLPKTDSYGRFYVPFTAGPGGYYDGVSISDLISGEVSPDYYAGKIVLIGPYAVGLQDAYFTPIEPASQMYGIEFHANVIESLISGNFKNDVPAALQGIILFAVTFLLLLFFTANRPVISGLTGAGALIISLAAALLMYSHAGLIIHPLWLPFGIIISYIASIVVHYVKAAAQRREITHTLERYVAPEIVSEILKDGTENLSLGGKLCNIAVLFVDVRGFTTMSERLDPEKVVFILNKYLDMASGCVDTYKGTLDKFVGDAMMAFWGAPLEMEDPVYNAVKTAKAITDGAARVSDELKNEIGEELKVGVGVHYGQAVVGNMGSERHMDYTAIGDTVNTAARLEANAPGGTVYISRAVADELEGRIKYTSLGDTVKLKGKAEGFEVLRLDEID
ncbi:MAG: adenylate/guanylate cyclase domain-containing protein [Lachnospiraceae bacterium]|nr:adenylate/guanylate cyclase domain-containing protein [Lachnospiraceae bacterium]